MKNSLQMDFSDCRLGQITMAVTVQLVVDSLLKRQGPALVAATGTSVRYKVQIRLQTLNSHFNFHVILLIFFVLGPLEKENL